MTDPCDCRFSYCNILPEIGTVIEYHRGRIFGAAKVGSKAPYYKRNAIPEGAVPNIPRGIGEQAILIQGSAFEEFFWLFAGLGRGYSG